MRLLSTWTSSRCGQITVTVTLPAFAVNTGLTKVPSDIDCILFPNPAASALNYTLTGFTGECTIVVTDVKGFTLANRKITVHDKETFQLDVSKLLPGLYWLQIYSLQGSKAFKFVKI